jgi:hypothetical protein
LPYEYDQLPVILSIGRHTGVARILGIDFSGFAAWWLWRTIYLLKFPRFEKKLRVALHWILDIFFSKDLVQYLHERAAAIADRLFLPLAKPNPLFSQLLAIRTNCEARIDSVVKIKFVGLSAREEF